MRCGDGRAIRGSAISRPSASQAPRPAPKARPSRRQPDARAVSLGSSRASPYHPSDRRFLDPFLIDVLAGEDLPSDSEFEAALAQAGPFAAVAALLVIDYEAVWTIKRAALRARFGVFERARAGAPAIRFSPTTPRFLAEGGDALRRFAIFEAISLECHGEDWRRWPAGLRDADAIALADAAAEHADEVRFALFCQWLADRQLAAAAARAEGGGTRNRSLSRSRGRLGARRRGELVARRRTRGRRQRRRAARPVLREARTGACRRRSDRGRARAGGVSLRSTAPTCTTPVCCGSITRWA